MAVRSSHRRRRPHHRSNRGSCTLAVAPRRRLRSPRARLYRFDAWHVAAAAVLGTPLAGSMLMAVDAREVGESWRIPRILSLGLTGSVLVALACTSMPWRYPASLFWVFAGASMGLYAHMIAGGGRSPSHPTQMRSPWGAVILGLVCGVFCLWSVTKLPGLLGVGSTQQGQTWSRIVGRSGLIVEYETAAGSARARVVAAALKGCGLVPEEGATIRLVRDGALCIVHLSLTRAASARDAIEFEGVGKMLSAVAFSGGPLRLCLARGSEPPALCLQVPGLVDEQGGVNLERGREWMALACRRGFLPMVESLLALGVDANATDGVGALPLAYAVLHGHPKLARRLVEGGADVNAVQADGCTVLHVVAAHGRVGAVAFLAKHGAKVDAVESSGQTPLHGAAGLGRRDMVRCLVEAGAELDAVDRQGLTPLHLAVEGGHLEAARLLVEKGAKLNLRAGGGRITPLSLALARPRRALAMVGLLRDRGGRP